MTEIEQMTSEVYKFLHPEGCWHEKGGGDFAPFRFRCKKCLEIIEWQDIHPEYISRDGRVRLLQEMMAREDATEFFNSILVVAFRDTVPYAISIKYITDKNNEGLLLRAVYEFMRRK